MVLMTEASLKLALREGISVTYPSDAFYSAAHYNNRRVLKRLKGRRRRGEDVSRSVKLNEE